MNPNFRFDKYEESVLNKIGDFVDLLTSTKKKLYKKSERFKEESIEFDDKENLLAKIEEEILYQRRLAEKIVQLSLENTVNAKRSGYYWICSLENEESFDFVQVCLYITAEGGKYGNILYPLEVILDDRKKYRFWEVINEEDAIDAAKHLMQLED